MLYGAAEFSRDTDLAILSSSENISELSEALKELKADSQKSGDQTSEVGGQRSDAGWDEEVLQFANIFYTSPAFSAGIVSREPLVSLRVFAWLWYDSV